MLLAALGAAAAAFGLLMPLQPAVADVFKYVDGEGNVYFSDARLDNPSLRLEWKRTAARLVAENRERSQRWQAGAGVGQGGEAPRAAAPVSGSMSVRRARYRHLVDAAAQRHGLMPELLHAVIRTESAYRPDAMSHAGACGLMQLMPGTAARFGVRDIWDPAENIRGGATYLRFLLDLFDHDLRLALAGYNAGENAVRRHGNRIPPYRETQDYVRKVMRFLRAEAQPWQS